MPSYRPSFSTRQLCVSAMTAALYAMLTCALAPISFGAGGAVQFRVSEVLTLLPILTDAAIPGLFIGCLLANLLCGAPLADILIGSLATLTAAMLTRLTRRRPPLAALMPVVCNAVMVGIMLSAVYTLPLWYAIGTVALGEAAVCFLLGLPLVRALERSRPFMDFISEKRTAPKKTDGYK